jgi:hypothetical protein
MFTHVTTLLYKKASQPSETHRAIASLGASQQVSGGGPTRGWDCVITYNFDDLMGEAFTERKVPYTRWF